MDGTPLLSVSIRLPQQHMSSQEVVSMTVPAFADLWAVSHHPSPAPVTCQVPVGPSSLSPNEAKRCWHGTYIRSESA